MSVGTWYHWYRTGSSVFVRSWFICAAVLFVTVVRSGLHYSYGEFLVDLRDDFNGSSMTEGNWIGTLVMTTSMTAAPVSVSFIRLFDARGYQYCIFGGMLLCAGSCVLSSLMASMHALVGAYSLLQGVGTSLTYMASSLILVDYFDKAHPYHVLGTSILYCGYPLGSVIFNPIYAALVDAYGWRVAFRIAAALLFFSAFASAPLFVSRYSNEEYELLKMKEAKGSLLIPFAQVRRPEVLLWFTVNLTTFLGFYMPVVNLPSYMRDKGYLGPGTSLAVTVLSFSEIVAYIGASLVGDLLKGRLIVANLVSSLALASIYFVWPSVDEAGWAMIIALSVGSGFFLGFAIVYTFAETVDITRLPQDQAWGYTNLCSGVGLLMGPLLTGGIYDVRHSHDDVFYVTGCIFLLQLALYCCLVYFVHRRDERERPLFDAAATFGDAGGGSHGAVGAPIYSDYTQLRGDDDDDADAGYGGSLSRQQFAVVNNNYNYGGVDSTVTTAPTAKISTSGANRKASLRKHRQSATVVGNSPLAASTTMTAPRPSSNNNSLSIEVGPPGHWSVESGGGHSDSSSHSSLSNVQSSGRMYTQAYSANDPRILYDK